MPRKAKDPFALLTYADGLVEDLRRLLPKVVKQSETEAIHNSRVATRRLRAVVSVVAPVLSGEHRKSFEKVLRQLRRRLGPLRDTDVMLEHLREIKTSRLRDARNWLNDRLKEERDELREAVTKTITPAKMLARLGSWWGVREEVAECQQAVDTLLAEAVHLQLDAFVERAEALLADRPVNSQEESAGSPHQLRIAGKHLRYVLEMAVVEGHRLPAATVKLFRQMQDSLGLWHDYVVLTDAILHMSREKMLAARDAALQLAVLDLARLSVQASVRHLGRFRLLWSRVGEELARSIRSSFPLTRPVAAPEGAVVDQAPPLLLD